MKNLFKTFLHTVPILPLERTVLFRLCPCLEMVMKTASFMLCSSSFSQVACFTTFASVNSFLSKIKSHLHRQKIVLDGLNGWGCEDRPHPAEDGQTISWDYTRDIVATVPSRKSASLKFIKMLISDFRFSEPLPPSLMST